MRTSPTFFSSDLPFRFSFSRPLHKKLTTMRYLLQGLLELNGKPSFTHFMSRLVPYSKNSQRNKFTHIFFAVKHPSQINGQAKNQSDPSTDLLGVYQEAALQLSALIKRPLSTFSSQGSIEPQTVILILGKDDFVSDVEGVLFLSTSLVTPLPRFFILDLIPPSTKRVIVLEQIHKWHSKWTPLYLDTVAALQERSAEGLIVQSGELCNPEDIKKADIETLIRTSTPGESPASRLRIGVPPILTETPHSLPHIPKHEASYTKILSQLFQDRFEIANAPELALTLGESATTPEFALGRVRGLLESRTELVNSVQELLRDSEIDSELHSLLTQWILAKEDPVKSKPLGKAIIENLKSSLSEKPSCSTDIVP
jgi:sulfite reductase (NADPH) hemoprotein beta-component